MPFGSETKVISADPRTVLRAAVFIDFWNLIRGAQSTLGKRAPEFEWDVLPEMLLSKAVDLMGTRQVRVAFELHGVYVYGSKAGSGLFSQQWFKDNLMKKPGFIVKTVSKKSEKLDCRNCGAQFKRSREKGADASLISDLMWLAWQNRYDVAFLVSSDRDMIPTIERVQISGRRVIAVTPSTALEVPSASFASISLEGLLLDGFHRFYSHLYNGPPLSRMATDHRLRLLNGEDPHELVIELAQQQPETIPQSIKWYFDAARSVPGRQERLLKAVGFARDGRIHRPEDGHEPTIDDLTKTIRGFQEVDTSTAQPN